MWTSRVGPLTPLVARRQAVVRVWAGSSAVGACAVIVGTALRDLRLALVVLVVLPLALVSLALLGRRSSAQQAMLQVLDRSVMRAPDGVPQEPGPGRRCWWAPRWCHWSAGRAWRWDGCPSFRSACSASGRSSCTRSCAALAPGRSALGGCWLWPRDRARDAAGSGGSRPLLLALRHRPRSPVCVEGGLVARPRDAVPADHSMYRA